MKRASATLFCQRMKLAMGVPRYRCIRGRGMVMSSHARGSCLKVYISRYVAKSAHGYKYIEGKTWLNCPMRDSRGLID